MSTEPSKSLVLDTDALSKRALEMGEEGVGALERIIALAERERAHIARQEYHAALQLVQAEMPRIAKDGQNTQTRSRYPRLENVDRHLRPVYTRHGFDIYFSTDPTAPVPDGWIMHIATVSHVGGHSERIPVPFPIDDKGPQGKPTKTAMHGVGSALSYAQRKLTLMAFGGVAADEDDDGQAATQAADKPITAEQAANLRAMAEEAGVDTARFLKWAKSDSWETIAADKYQRCHDELDGRRKNRNISDDPR